MGLHPSEIVIGYEKGAKRTLKLLEELTCYESKNLRDQDELSMLIKTTLASK